jgi:hypothetical protein
MCCAARIKRKKDKSKSEGDVQQDDRMQRKQRLVLKVRKAAGRPQGVAHPGALLRPPPSQRQAPDLTLELASGLGRCKVGACASQPARPAAYQRALPRPASLSRGGKLSRRPRSSTTRLQRARQSEAVRRCTASVGCSRPASAPAGWLAGKQCPAACHPALDVHGASPPCTHLRGARSSRADLSSRNPRGAGPPFELLAGRRQLASAGEGSRARGLHQHKAMAGA